VIQPVVSDGISVSSCLNCFCLPVAVPNLYDFLPCLLCCHYCTLLLSYTTANLCSTFGRYYSYAPSLLAGGEKRNFSFVIALLFVACAAVHPVPSARPSLSRAAPSVWVSRAPSPAGAPSPSPPGVPPPSWRAVPELHLPALTYGGFPFSLCLCLFVFFFFFLTVGTCVLCTFRGVCCFA
jgi:hypothetical protein